MTNKYRVDWQAGMRLTDETFRASDEYYISCLQPLYTALTNGNYGLLELPVFRYEINDSCLSVTEFQINAISFSGKLIRLSFNRTERNLFQNINLPDVAEPIILFIDKTSDKTIKVSSQDAIVPLCDAEYQILVKLESEHYNNPDAVPFARFIYNHGWSMDMSFIAPVIALRANGSLLRSATNYAVEVEELIKSLKGAIQTEQYVMIISALPTLNRIALEVRKESDAMNPRHLITLMQEGIQMLISLSEVEGITIPQKERCIAFVESHYTPYIISELINEGIALTHILTTLPQYFEERVTRTPEPEITPARPQRRIGSTDSIRKKHH